MINNNDSLCNEHNQIYNNYCIQCKKYFCTQCNKESHQSHQLTSLSDNISTHNINSTINQGYNHINGYCKKLKANKINSLLSTINQLEYSYQSFKSVNTDILNLIQIIVNNFHTQQYNYYFRENVNNIIKKYKIELYKLTNDKNKDEIVNYYHNYEILFPLVNINDINNTKEIKDHTSQVASLLLLSDGRLASCSRDKTIKIFNINNNYYQCDLTIEGHTDTVTYISQLDNNKLVSCSCDKSIKIWSFTRSSYNCDYTIQDAHTKWINKVIPIKGGKMVSCSDDMTIKVWKSNSPYTLVKTLEGHTGCVNSIIQLKGKDILISGSSDWNLIKWDLVTYERNNVTDGVLCSYQNSMIEIDNKKIIVGGDKITVVNVSNCRIEYTIIKDELGFVYSFMILRDGNILCGYDNGLLCIYDIQNNTLTLKENKIHDKNDIICLLNINKYKFVSCAFDNTINVWEY